MDENELKIFINMCKAMGFKRERTCHFTEYPDEYLDELGLGYCSECGEQLYDNYLYCPNCGAKVVNE